jgi:hypothetical protein
MTKTAQRARYTLEFKQEAVRLVKFKSWAVQFVVDRGDILPLHSIHQWSGHRATGPPGLRASRP